MIYNLYSVYDAKAGQYSAPFTASNEEVAVRNFHALLVHDKLMFDFKADFFLYQVGTFDDQHGDLFKIVPISVASGNDFVLESK